MNMILGFPFRRIWPYRAEASWLLELIDWAASSEILCWLWWKFCVNDAFCSGELPDEAIDVGPTLD